MVNYNNGKIYKIESINVEDSDIYIGSTTKKLLSMRMSHHRSTYKKYKISGFKSITSYKIFNKYGLDNCIITLLENVNAKSKDELFTREAYYIRTLKCVNKVIPNRTQKQYRDDNKENLQDYRKNYRIDNKDKIFDYMKEYLIEYKEINKIKLSIQRSQKIFCDCCNIEFNITNKARHNKSKIHLEKISNI
jgi:ribosome-interacting GTPase 1